MLKLEEMITHLGLFRYTNSSASAELFVFTGGSICKNSAVLFTFFGGYGIIILGGYLLDKLEFVEKIATASCLSTPATRDII